MAKDFNRSHFIGNFVKEARERIRRVEHGLISLETSKGNLEILPEILREIHTIKGSANMLGLKNISALAHSIESVLGKEKEGERFLNPPAMNILYQSMDMLFRMVEVIGQGGKETIDPSDICSTLTAVISPEERDEKTIGGQVSLPTETTLMPTYQYPHISHLGTVRIDTNRIDRLSKISTELIYWIMHESERYQQMRNLLSPFIRELPGELWANYQKIVESCDEQEVLGNRLLHDLQEEVLSISLVSLAHAFEGLPRSVRDLSQELGKEVELIMGGGEIAVDQKIIDQIGAPLIHLIRNAIDHGIETPHQRKLLGKPSKGKLRVSASQKANRVLIEIEDDGQGMNLPKIREEIVKKGFMPHKEAASLTERELLRYVFKPGFSTQPIITEVSGRGVGLDVVKETVEQLNGTVTLLTEKGKGSTCILDLPFYLAIMPSLLFTAGESTFALSLNCIEEIVQADTNKVVTLKKRDVIPLHGKTIPVAKLTNLFQLPAIPRNGHKYYVLIIKQGNQRVGLLVDKVLEEENIVIRKLGRYFNNTEGITGVTLLSNGDVALVLNASVFVEAVIQGLHRGIFQEEERIEDMGKEQLSLLLVEDSLIVRDLERSILQVAGYKVETAGDGLEALVKLKAQDFDLIITDIEMPQMNGFELISAVRSDDQHKNIPIIIVTTREKKEDKLRGLELGADAYLLKSSFDQEEILAIIEKLVRRPYRSHT